MLDDRRVLVALCCVAAMAACGGSAETPPHAPSIQVQPSTAELPVQTTLPFSAAVTGLASASVTWSADCGSVSSSGLYTAPPTAGTCRVTAHSVADPSVSGLATVTVTSQSEVTDPAAQLQFLSQKGIWMAHESVGYNILGGLQRLLDANAGPEPTISNDTSNPNDISSGVFGQQYFPNIGDGSAHNGQPVAKILAFRSVIDGGMGAKVDVAFMKFCFADFDNLTDDAWVQGAFATYRSTFAALEAAYPRVKFVHVTVPFYKSMNDGGFAIGNVRREEMSDLIRANFPSARVFDLALMESTDPAGNRVLDVMSDVGIRPHAMYDGYTTDGGHLTNEFADAIARKLVAFLANLK
jgi:hypothetical protein